MLLASLRAASVSYFNMFLQTSKSYWSTKYAATYFELYICVYFTTALAAQNGELQFSLSKSREPMGKNIQVPPRNFAENWNKYYIFLQYVFTLTA
jgi:hypothetical protein